MDECKGISTRVYVDDFVLMGEKCRIYEMKQTLLNEFDIKDLGPILSILSIDVCRPTIDIIELNQSRYIRKILKELNMDECKGISTPMEMKNGDDNTEQFDEYTYRRAMGSLIYLANVTRPDISFAAAYLSQFNNCATKGCWTKVKRVLRYLRKTENAKLVFKKSGEKLRFYVDADWASDQKDRKSWSGFVIKFASAAIEWRTRKQRTVSLSTVEAEYVAMTEIVKEWLWIKNFITELGMIEFLPDPCVINCDNQGAISLSKSKVISSKSKHIDVKLHFLRDLVDKHEIIFEYVSTDNNIADIFTKPLGRVKNEEFCIKLGLKLELELKMKSFV
ncbi:Reverse transcriptase (RNA-dependent DNA polymerase) [Popillia japonica]|uniref:Reverse transcriptase (RNA-dependent DNA polymerase) n=1 Tax=Popillia japonica TaxID=7064 RepID=A0AAW1K5R6_POPJA